MERMLEVFVWVWIALAFVIVLSAPILDYVSRKREWELKVRQMELASASDAEVGGEERRSTRLGRSTWYQRTRSRRRRTPTSVDTDSPEFRAKYKRQWMDDDWMNDD